MSPSILVVDDDETIRETLVEFFSALELPARAVATASDGRRAIAEHSPDVALIDLRLPDADGMTLLEAIRADDLEVAVIVLTGQKPASSRRPSSRSPRRSRVDSSGPISPSSFRPARTP